MDFIIIIALLMVNGLFAMYEMALVSSSRARLEMMSAAGNKNAARVISQIASPEKMLSTIQVGITLIGIVSGAFGGVALSDDLRPIVESV
ncbi:MAG: CNNM domain-containing protein, partial [Mucinivorans sp.]